MGRSVADLVADPDRPADVAVTPHRAQGAVPARLRRGGRRLHGQPHLARPGDPRGAGPAGRGAAGQRVGAGRRDAALARRRRAQRRGRRRRRHAGRRPGREVLHLPLRRRPGRHLLVPLAPGLARAGPARPARRPGGHPAGAGARTSATSSPSCTCTTASRPSTAATGAVPVDAPDGQTVRVRVVNTDNGATPVWVVRRAVPGAGGGRLRRARPDAGRPAQAVRLTAGGRVDLEVTAPARVELGGAVRARPRVAAAPADPQPTELVDLLPYGTPAPLGFDPSDGRPALRLLGRPPARLPRRPARPVVVDQRPPVPRRADVRRRRGRRGADAHREPQPARRTRCTCTATTRWSCPATA